jgi:branched-chain amino acid transport system permease protein
VSLVGSWAAPARRVAPWMMVGLALIFPLIYLDPTIRTIAIFTLMYVAGATAWNLCGFSGYFSFGHAAFHGVGAYAAVLLAERWAVPGGLSMFLLIPLAGLITAAIAIPVGVVALRARHMIFAMVTFALFFIAQQLAFNLDGLTRGARGLGSPITPWGPEFFHIPFYYAALLVALVSIGLAAVIHRSKFGLGLKAIRDDEDRALGLGVHTGRGKLVAFTLSGLITGMVGSIFAFFVTSVYPQFAFSGTYNITVVLCALLGGMATVYGPALGACIVVPAQQYASLRFGLSGWDDVVYGAMFLLIILFLPAGIVPTLSRSRSLRAGRTKIDAPDAVSTTGDMAELSR